jgi:hypothetical protein
MRETLRLTPPAPARSVMSLEDTTLAGGKYAIKARAPIVLQFWSIHRAPLVWGDDVCDTNTHIRILLTDPGLGERIPSGTYDGW